MSADLIPLPLPEGIIPPKKRCSPRHPDKVKWDNPPTGRTADFLYRVAAFVRVYGRPPRFREMTKIMNHKSTGEVYRWAKMLRHLCCMMPDSLNPSPRGWMMLGMLDWPDVESMCRKLINDDLTTDELATLQKHLNNAADMDRRIRGK